MFWGGGKKNSCKCPTQLEPKGVECKPQLHALHTIEVGLSTTTSIHPPKNVHNICVVYLEGMVSRGDFPRPFWGISKHLPFWGGDFSWYPVGIWQVSLEVFFSCSLAWCFSFLYFIYWIKKTCFSMVMPLGLVVELGPSMQGVHMWPGTLRIAKSLPLFPPLCQKAMSPKDTTTSVKNTSWWCVIMFCFI